MPKSIFIINRSVVMNFDRKSLSYLSLVSGAIRVFFLSDVYNTSKRTNEIHKETAQ